MTIPVLGSLLLCVPLLMPLTEAQVRTQRIACLRSETGDLTSRGAAGSYPDELRKMLGDAFQVMTFQFGKAVGVKAGTVNRLTRPVDPAVLQWLPDIVLIEPGIVDSALGDTASPSDPLVETVRGLRNIRSRPRVMLLLPPPSLPVDPKEDSLLLGGTIQRLWSVAFATGCEVVDLHSLFLGGDGYARGEDHAAVRGGAVVAARLRDLLMIDEVTPIDVAGLAGGSGARSNYYGYECFDFRFSGREARIVRPKKTAKGRPWIWRARFWGHEPQTEIALLERGFHVAYCDVAEMYGNDEAIGIWDRFYEALTGAGLSKKAALEGLSRGGIYVYRWAVHSPSRVACVYADAPVLDLKSWPGGKGRGGGNPEEWQRFKDDFGLASEEEALAFRGNPLDMAPEIARGGYPMLHVCGLADVVVPIEENTDPFEKKILQSGGRITVIRKPGIGHHPHSLPNPGRIVDFIVGAASGTSPR